MSLNARSRPTDRFAAPGTDEAAGSRRWRPVALGLTLAWPILVACSCGSANAGRADRPNAGADPTAVSEAGSGAATSGKGPLTEAECMRLLDHYLELAVAEKRASLPPDQVPTAEQVQRIRTSLGEEAKASCIGNAERRRYDCALRAKTTRGVGVCLSE